MLGLELERNIRNSYLSVFLELVVCFFSRMAKHAGSVFKEGRIDFGRIDFWYDWKPAIAETKWLLLSGSSNPPEIVRVSERRPRGKANSRDSPFLHGMNRDFTNMTDALVKKGLELFSSLNKLRITKADAKEQLKEIFDACKSDKKQAVIYYTGHGEIGTGNWCFRDGTISIEDLENLIPSGCFHPFIISDCCYSGRWADYCLNKGIDGFHCLAACPYFTTAIDISKEGGELTCYMTDKIDPQQLTKTPVCSKMDDENSPVDQKIDCFFDLFSVYLGIQTRSVKCHTIANGKLSAIFTKKKGSGNVSWADAQNLTEVESTFDRKKRNGKICSSFACDKNNFLMVFKECIAEQLLLHGDEDSIHTNICKAWAKNMRITGCAAYKSSWVIIMTSGIIGSDLWKTEISWNNLVTYIKEQQKDGYMMKGLCYNLKLKKYFLYMRDTLNSQEDVKDRCFQEGELREARDWLKKNENEYEVSFIFKDPEYKSLFIALEKTDSPDLDLDLAFDFFQNEEY